MVTGASTADLALVLVDARNGVVEQSRRHAFIASLLRIPHLVVCVNKMDLVGFSEAAFEQVVEDFTHFAAKLEIADVTFIPISALEGDNVVDRSERMPWYGGPPLLYHLEHVHIASDRNLIDPRLPVQWVVRPGEAASEELHDYRGYAGQIAGGVLRRGDEVLVLPSGEHSRIEAIDTFEGPVEEAFAPMSVTVRLTDDVDVSRGDMIARPQNRPLLERDIDAMVCWMSETPSKPDGRYVIKHTARSTRAVITSLLHRIDVDTLHREEGAGHLQLNDIGRMRLRTAVPLAFDTYRRNRSTGSFILIDEVTNDTVAAGMILGTAEVEEERSPNVVWDRAGVTRERRVEALGRTGATLWFTGLPSSGKSTIAAALEHRLVAAGVPAYRLDGDNLRHGLNADLGFSADDRAENVRRTAHVAQLLADSGVVAIPSLVSPYRADRDLARQVHQEAGVPFLEVFVDTPLEECEKRDPKGLYARARAGEIKNFTGIDDPYEAPQSPEVRLGPGDVDAAVEEIWSVLVARGLVEP
jgi:bifunctional enzyme CysN/CysC